MQPADGQPRVPPHPPGQVVTVIVTFKLALPGSKSSALHCTLLTINIPPQAASRYAGEVAEISLGGVAGVDIIILA